MNGILISCAGRRVELVQAFQEQVRERGFSSMVHATDVDPTLSAACHVADVSARLPPVLDPEYADSLKDYCQRNNIGLIVPTIDTELVLLAKLRNDFKCSEIEVVISESTFVEKCRDKRLTGDLFSMAGFSYPNVYDVATTQFPCFAKPYDGSSGVDARALYSTDDLGEDLLSNPRMMYMEYISKEFCEYTVDAYFDKDSALRCIVPRKRLEVRAGEVSKGITKKNFVFEQLLRGFKKCSGARGCVTIQVFVNESIEEIIGLEINPRFGGGYPLSYAAGANYPGWLIDEYLCGRHLPDFHGWDDGLLMLRYDAKVVISNASA